MSIKKYLSLEEAAGLLKLKTDELIRLREKGDVRGFADRGTWKFKAEDIEELKRRLQPDSNPEVPMLDDDDELGREPTIITKGRGGISDSDVRLMPDNLPRKGKLTGSSAEMPVLADSDSDVRLAGDKTRELPPTDSDVKLVVPGLEDSDSDVKLADSDSDVRLSDSDSDVRLAPPLPSDSDVKLVGRGQKNKSSDSDVKLAPRSGKTSGKGIIDFDDAGETGAESVLLEDSGMALAADSGIRLGTGSSIRLPGDSGVALTAPADSGILLEGDGESSFPLRGDSSQTLSDLDDSDLALDEDSGITIESDSGIHLAGDSGIRLDADSGIKLSDAPPSGVKGRKSKDDLDSSIPMLLADDADRNRTDAEVPMLLNESSEMETLNLPSSPRKKGKGDTSVILFEEDDDSGKGLDESSGNLGGDDDETYGLNTMEVALDDEDELEVAEDILGDDDDDLEQMEVFDSDDSVFDESFVEGGSAVGISALPSRIAVPQEVDWGSGTLALLAGSSLFLTLGALIAVDLLRTVWGRQGSAVYEGELIGLFAGLFK